MNIAKLAGAGLLAILIGTAGCGGGDTPPKNDKVVKGAPKKDDDDHDHGPGPHGGTVIEFGKYHGEFTVDHEKQEATVYILDGAVKNAVPIAVEKLALNIKNPAFHVELKAAPQEGDPAGKSSRFVGKHEKLGVEQEFEGTVSGKIDGKPYSGDFKEKEHKDHKHGKK